MCGKRPAPTRLQRGNKSLACGKCVTGSKDDREPAKCRTHESRMFPRCSTMINPHVKSSGTTSVTYKRWRTSPEKRYYLVPQFKRRETTTVGKVRDVSGTPGHGVSGVRAYPPTHRQPLRLLHTLDWTPTHPPVFFVLWHKKLSPRTRPTRRNDAFALVRRACGCRHQLLAVRLLRLLRFPKQ